MSRHAGAALLACALGACAVGPHYRAPRPDVPAQFTELQADEQRKADAAAEPGSFWWREFHDVTLDQLEDRIARDNLDLKAAYLRIVEARTQVQSARAAGLPSLNAAASYTREQFGLAGIVRAQHLETAGPASSATAQGLISQLERPVNLYQLGFDASWELDLFGRVRHSVESADARSAAAVAARDDLLVSLQAEIAQNYFQLRAAQLLERIVREQISDQQTVLDLTTNRQQHGLAQEADVEAAHAQLATLQSQLPPYTQAAAAAQHALAVLAGVAPGALDVQFGPGGDLPALPANVPVGVPSQLARRRPDIRESEESLRGATAQVGVAVASLFPDISLNGTLGSRNLNASYLFDWDSKFYTFGPTVSVPIFHGGALIANVQLSRAQAAEAALNYRKTVLTALQEVEDGLSSVVQDAQRTHALQEAAAAEQRSVQVSLEAYQHGLVSYINVLSVQLQAVQTRQQLAQALLSQNTDLVKLFKALGGGWQAAASDAPTAVADGS